MEMFTDRRNVFIADLCLVVVIYYFTGVIYYLVKLFQCAALKRALLWLCVAVGIVVTEGTMRTPKTDGARKRWRKVW